ncbi:MAG: alpha/beta hydrolase family protein [Victivallaceae bacterium]
MMPHVINGMMLQNYYKLAFEAIGHERKRVLAKIDSRSRALAYRNHVRKLLAGAFDLPRRSPLEAEVAGSFRANGALIDKVIFESRPGFKVTALFLRPEAARAGLPAVLGLCGHAQEGKAADAYLRYAFSLVNNGFAVLIPDPAGQGERGQFERLGDSDFCRGRCCSEHNQIGKGLLLCGEHFAEWRVWDAMAALDYLAGRPEVDPSRLGVTGNSGGGTLSTYLWALDHRLAMGAPGCYITTFRRNFDNELPVDAEQVIPELAQYGFEMADFLIARAPSPVLVLGRSNDFFDVRGAAESFAEAKRIYRLLGAEKNIQFFVSPGDHGYGLENREAMVRFFGEHAGVEVVIKEPADLVIPPPPKTFCTAAGQVAALANSNLLPELLAEKAAALAARRKTPDKASVKRFIADELGAEYSKKAPAERVLRCAGHEKGVTVSRFAVMTEPGVEGYLALRDDAGPHYQIPVFEETLLYVAHLDAESELKKLPLRTFGLDVRGIGASRPLTADRDDDFFAIYGADYFYDSAGAMTGDPLLGGKIHDVLATIALLRERGAKRIHLLGHGLGAIVAAFAAVAAGKKVERVTLSGAPLSFTEMIKRGVWRWPQSHAPRGMLRKFDLADLYRLLAARDLKLIEPWDDRMEPFAADALERELAAAGVPASLLGAPADWPAPGTPVKAAPRKEEA